MKVQISVMLDVKTVEFIDNDVVNKYGKYANRSNYIADVIKADIMRREQEAEKTTNKNTTKK